MQRPVTGKQHRSAGMQACCGPQHTAFVPCAVQNKYKMTMGLEPMNVNDWIEIDDAYEEEMALRRKLVSEKRDIVIHSMPGVRHTIKPMLEHISVTTALGGFCCHRVCDLLMFHCPLDGMSRHRRRGVACLC